MKKVTLKQNEQATWYENGQLIEAYLKRSRKSSPAEELFQVKKLSLLEMLKAARSRDKDK